MKLNIVGASTAELNTIYLISKALLLVTIKHFSETALICNILTTQSPAFLISKLHGEYSILDALVITLLAPIATTYNELNIELFKHSNM